MMVNRDQDSENRAEKLLESIKPELLTLLKTAPQYGEVGLGISFCQGNVVRLSTRCEITRKLTPQTGSNDGR
jgi:hypothetical protein